MGGEMRDLVCTQLLRPFHESAEGILEGVCGRSCVALIKELLQTFGFLSVYLVAIPGTPATNVVVAEDASWDCATVDVWCCIPSLHIERPRAKAHAVRLSGFG